MSLIVKAALLKGDENSQFRRFTLTNEDKNYGCLEKKLAELFSVENFELKWKDADGDYVTFSSDEELQEAFKCITNGVLKIYVSERQTPTDNEYGNQADPKKQRPTIKTPQDSSKKKPQVFGHRGKTWLLHGNVPSSQNAVIRNRLLTEVDDSTKPLPNVGWKHIHRRMQRRNQNESNENVSQWFERRKLKWLKRHQLQQETDINDTQGRPNRFRPPKRTGGLRDLNKAIDDLHIGFIEKEFQEKGVDKGRIRRPIGVFGRQHHGKNRTGNRYLHMGRASSCPGRLPGICSNLTFQLRRRDDTERHEFGRFRGQKNWRRKWSTPDEEPTSYFSPGLKSYAEQAETDARNLKNDQKLRIKLKQLDHGSTERLDDRRSFHRRFRCRLFQTPFGENLQRGKRRFFHQRETGQHHPHKRHDKMIGFYHAGPKKFLKMRQMRLLKDLKKLEEKKESVKNKLDQGCNHKHVPHGNYMYAKLANQFT